MFTNLMVRIVGLNRMAITFGTRGLPLMVIVRRMTEPRLVMMMRHQHVRLKEDQADHKEAGKKTIHWGAELQLRMS